MPEFSPQCGLERWLLFRGTKEIGHWNNLSLGRML